MTNHEASLAEAVDAALFDAWDLGFTPVGIRLRCGDRGGLMGALPEGEGAPCPAGASYRGVAVDEAGSGLRHVLAQRPSCDLRLPRGLTVEIRWSPEWAEV